MLLKILPCFWLPTLIESITLFVTVLVLLGEVSVEVDPVCVLAAAWAEAEKAATSIACPLT
jgi:hypothetical protein